MAHVKPLQGEAEGQVIVPLQLVHALKDLANLEKFVAKTGHVELHRIIVDFCGNIFIYSSWLQLML